MCLPHLGCLLLTSVLLASTASAVKLALLGVFMLSLYVENLVFDFVDHRCTEARSLGGNVNVVRCRLSANVRPEIFEDATQRCNRLRLMHAEKSVGATKLTFAPLQHTGWPPRSGLTIAAQEKAR